MKAKELMDNVAFDKELQKSPTLKKLYYQEKLTLTITELVSKLMLEKNVSKTKLAKKLGLKKSDITQFLNGSSIITLEFISDILTVLDSELSISTTPFIEDQYMNF